MGTWTTLQRPWTCCCSTWTSDRLPRQWTRAPPAPILHRRTLLPRIPGPRLPRALPFLSFAHCQPGQVLEVLGCLSLGQSQPSPSSASLYRLPVNIPPSLVSGQRFVPCLYGLLPSLAHSVFPIVTSRKRPVRLPENETLRLTSPSETV